MLLGIFQRHAWFHHSSEICVLFVSGQWLLALERYDCRYPLRHAMCRIHVRDTRSSAPHCWKREKVQLASCQRIVRRGKTHFRHGYHTRPAAPLAAVKYLVDESWIMCAVSGSASKSSLGTNHRMHAQPVSPAWTTSSPRTCFTAVECTPSAATMRSACRTSPFSVVTFPFSAS